jgi:RNA recognition motif-containing protein
MAKKQGTVAKWLNHRGIGFITPDGQDTEIGKDLLVHHSHIKQSGENGEGGDSTFKTLQTGSRVEFDTAQDPKNPDKLIAINVTGIGGGDCERQQRRRLPARNNNKDNVPVYVSNLNSKGSWKQLKDLFKQVGFVEWCETSRDNTSGEVRFKNQEEAQKAVERFHGYEFNGNTLKVTLEKK